MERLHLRHVLRRTIAVIAAHLPNGPATLEAASSRKTWEGNEKYLLIPLMMMMMPKESFEDENKDVAGNLDHVDDGEKLLHR